MATTTSKKSQNSNSARKAGEMSPAQSANAMQPTTDFADYLKQYARAKPEVAALWCVGIGFVLGWKLKPW